MTLLDPKDNEALVARIALLTPDRRAEWGRMNAAQMCCHLQAPLRVGLGELTLKRGLVGLLFGSAAKRKLSSDAPWQRNLPTDKAFRITGEREFFREREALVSLVRRFAAPGAAATRMHPFFGRMAPGEWGVMMWKHIDHHLGQFGV